MSPAKTVEEYFEILKKFARQKGLIFHPDEGIVLPLVEGLFANIQRYRYPSCPCRLASGSIESDRDIICPCEYAEPDIRDFGQCYCNLYVSQEVALDPSKAQTVPERRPPEKFDL